MKPLPMLSTPRLVLRPLAMADAATVQQLAGDARVAATTLNIPHPYADGMAEKWITRHAAEYDDGKSLTLAIAVAGTGALVGAVGLTFSPLEPVGELGYWIGFPYWNQGYATEASATLLHFAFGELGLSKIMARHIATNPASGRVMQKLGMMLREVKTQHCWKDGLLMDSVIYEIEPGMTR